MQTCTCAAGKGYSSVTQLYKLTIYSLLAVPNHSDQPARLFGWSLPNSFWAKWVILKVWSNLAWSTLAEADGAEFIVPEKWWTAKGHKIFHYLSLIQRSPAHSWSQQIWKGIAALGSVSSWSMMLCWPHISAIGWFGEEVCLYHPWAKLVWKHSKQILAQKLLRVALMNYQADFLEGKADCAKGLR